MSSSLGGWGGNGNARIGSAGGGERAVHCLRCDGSGRGRDMRGEVDGPCGFRGCDSFLERRSSPDASCSGCAPRTSSVESGTEVIDRNF